MISHNPLPSDHRRRGYAYVDDSFELSRIPIVQEELLAVLMARAPRVYVGEAA